MPAKSQSVSSDSTATTIESLIKTRNDLSTKISSLQQQLDTLSTERYAIDKEIQRIQFVSESTIERHDPECKKLISSFEKVRAQFEDSCKTPRDYDSEVPYRLSDDFADTHPFDDWTDQQLELFSTRREKIISVTDLISKCTAKPELEEELIEEFSAGVENTLRVLYKATELIHDMVETVSKIENADNGILLECRDNLMEHWHVVFGDESMIGKPEREEEIDSRFTHFFQMNPDFYGMLVDQLERIGKPFSLLVAKQ